jgi:putative oxidoreductase
MNDIVLLVARILLVALLIISGFGILAAPDGFAGFMGAIGLPAPTLVTWLVIALKIVGGLAVLVGFQTRYAAYALAAFCVGSALLGHMNFADQAEFNSFFKNLAMAGGLLALSVSGPGALSVDGRRSGSRLALQS